MAGRHGRRRARAVGLAVTHERSGDSGSAEPLVRWSLVAMLGGVAVAAAGYLVVLGLTTLAWLQETDASYGTVASVAARLWLGANGATVGLAGMSVRMLPLGFAAIVAVLLAGVSGFAGDQARAADERFADEEGADPDVSPWRRLGRIVGMVSGGYLLCVLLVGLAFRAGDLWAGLGWALVISVLSSGLGAARSTGLVLTASWPGWARSIPRAVGAGVLVLVVAGAALTGVEMLLNWSRFVQVQNALQTGALGGVVLLIAQLAYLPNVIAWNISWILGAGISLGTGSIVSPTATTVGLLPGIPMLAAAPSTDGRVPGGLWWMAAGIVSGAVAAVLVVRARPRARFDETAVVGALAGIVTGLVITMTVWASNGSLGTGLLAHVGGRMASLAIMSVSTIGLSGLVAGLVAGLIRGRAAPPRQLEAG